MRTLSSLSLTAAAVVVTLIAGCKTAPSSSGGGAAPSAPPPSSTATAPAPHVPPAVAAREAREARTAAIKSNLAIEKLRLAELFRGTPVLIALQPDGNLRVDVPLAFAFDAGKSTVKPPLAAVLDQLTNGQRNETTQLVVHAPNDPGAKASGLVGERATSVRDHLVGRGLMATRIVVAAPVASVVRVVVGEQP